MPFPRQDKNARLLLAFYMIAGACLCVPDTGHADELADETVARLDSVLEDLRAAHDVPGLAVGILENSEPVYAKGFGVRSLETDAPVDADTLFPVASISKTFTATAITQLAERQVVDLNARLSTYLPQFRRSGIQRDRPVGRVARYPVGRWRTVPGLAHLFQAQPGPIRRFAQKR